MSGSVSVPAGTTTYTGAVPAVSASASVPAATVAYTGTAPVTKITAAAKPVMWVST